jgi:hypothetical protein
MNTPAPHVRIFQEGEEVWYITGNGLARIGKVVSDAVMPNVRIPNFIFLFLSKHKRLITNHRELVSSLFELAHMW